MLMFGVPIFNRTCENKPFSVSFLFRDILWTESISKLASLCSSSCPYTRLDSASTQAAPLNSHKQCLSHSDTLICAAQPVIVFMEEAIDSHLRLLVVPPFRSQPCGQD